MKRVMSLLTLTMVGLLVTIGNAGAAGPLPSNDRNELASLQSFSRIADPNKRSAAYFTELSKVLTSPRCVNCHPAGDRPRQGDSSRLHQPPVYRGKDGLGLESMRCRTRHLNSNFDPGRVPGHAKWQLALIEMA